MPRHRRPHMASRIRERGASAARKRRPAQREAGRPTVYSPEIAAAVCERLMDGQSLRQICADAEMPAARTVQRWLADGQHRDFCQHYARAREAQAEMLADDILEIADDASGDLAPDGQIDWQNVQRSRLRVDARKWLASKLRPKNYGERLTQEVSGPGGGPIVTSAYSFMPPAEVAAAVRDLFARIERELELGDGSDLEPGERLRRVIGTGAPLPPALYAALHRGEKK